ncbi:MAG: hypothetical protein F4X04_04465 [Holophagales bacterium]|nr:hypothetical protein [Holophagales bacterium]MXX76459.1 hypothetical protein [Holophagales bacterium]MYD21473.1 hypothetical protein [Holophagales bacterium]
MDSSATKTDDRERLVRLAQGVPEAEVPAAVRYLEYLTDRADSYARFLLSAPETDRRLSEKCERGLEEAWADVEAGRVHGSEEVKRELGL